MLSRYQKSDGSAPHNVMPISNNAQSGGVNPNSLPWFNMRAIIADARRLSWTPKVSPP
jgi:hypothetical protein